MTEWAEVEAALAEEAQLAGSRFAWWYPRFLGDAYHRLVDAGLGETSPVAPMVALKVDLWNECISGARDVLAWLSRRSGWQLVGMDISMAVCAVAREYLPGVPVVQADIRALPFRAGRIGIVLDLSTLDHLDGAHVERALAEYDRVLAPAAVLVLVYWQRAVLVRLRLALGRLLGRRAKADQRFLASKVVDAALRGRLTLLREIPVCLLLALPLRIAGILLIALPAPVRARVLAWEARSGRASRWRGLMRVAPLRGVLARRLGPLARVPPDGPSGDVLAAAQRTDYP